MQIVRIIGSFVVFGILLFPPACSFKTSPKTSDSGIQVTWPKNDPQTAVAESAYLDLGLRVLALELSDQSRGRSTYFIQFLPRLGKVESRCILEKPPGLSITKQNQPNWSARIKEETEAIELGVKNLISDLKISQGFDSKEHLEIRFQVRSPEPEEIALVQRGQIHWLQVSH